MIANSTILITGSTGTIGKHLTRLLQQNGAEVLQLSRKDGRSDKDHYHWDPSSGRIDQEAVDRADHIIHLAGSNIGDGRWTAQKKKKILESRTRTGALLLEAAKQRNSPLKSFISMSAVGYYGAETNDRIHVEGDPPGSDFLAQVCVAWEEAAWAFDALGTRTVALRSGVVLNAEGGALTRMSGPVRFGLGAALGSGKQALPWIHVDDLCAMILFVLEHDELQGPINAVAPEQVTNKEFMRSLAARLNRPFWPIAVPSQLLTLILGQMGSMILEGSPINNERIRAAGFAFRYPRLTQALKDLL